MNSVQRRLREHSRLWPLAAMAAALLLFGLDTAYVLHHVIDDACPADHAGDPFDCYICTALLRVGMDVPCVVVSLAPQPGKVLPLPDATVLPQANVPRRASARAPPQQTL